MAETTTDEGLRRAIEQAGYYPALVSDTLAAALGGEPVQAYVVHHEPHFDGDQLRRHVTVAVLTGTRLVVGHTDDHPADEEHPQPFATASTEAVALSRVSSVVVSRTVVSPANYRPGGLAREVVMTVGWGAVSRADFEPAGCGDPECEADHGYTGTLTADDFSLRVSEAADGRGRVQDLLAFARTLSAATAGRR